MMRTNRSARASSGRSRANCVKRISRKLFPSRRRSGNAGQKTDGDRADRGGDQARRSGACNDGPRQGKNRARTRGKSRNTNGKGGTRGNDQAAHAAQSVQEREGRDRRKRRLAAHLKRSVAVPGVQ